MSETDRRQKLFYNRAQHQIRQIEFSCREVINLSQNLKVVAGEVNDTDVNCKKIEIIKAQIKEKLKEVASNIDQIYKVLDRKILLLAQELKKELKSQTNAPFSRTEYSNSSLNKTHIVEKNSQKTNEGSYPSSYDQERLFSDTLNPRVAQLQAILAQKENKQRLLNQKIQDLKSKNEKLLEQFNRLSTASNKKINELSSELHNITSRERDSFGSMENSSHSRNKPNDKYKPFLNFDLQPQPPFRSPKKNKDKNYNHTDLQDFELEESQSIVDAKNRPFTFGCMPGKATKAAKQQNSGLALYPKKLSENYQNLDKEDRNRRFDLLLNKLRYTEQPTAKAQSNTKPAEKQPESEQFGSVFAKEVVKRYQV